MEYVWKHGIEAFADFTLKFEIPLEVGNVFVDLYTGERYKVLSVPQEKGRDVVQTWSAGSCSKEGLTEIRRKAGYVVTENGKPRLDVFLDAVR